VCQLNPVSPILSLSEHFFVRDFLSLLLVCTFMKVCSALSIGKGSFRMFLPFSMELARSARKRSHIGGQVILLLIFFLLQVHSTPLFPFASIRHMSGLRIVLPRNREFDSRKRREIFSSQLSCWLWGLPDLLSPG
jgi:hypothetical protein